MLDIVRLFGWSYVSTLGDEGSYGEKGIGEFEKQARACGICIARSLKISREPTDSFFDQLVADLVAEKRARVIVMFVSEMNVKNLLRSMQRNNQSGTFYYLASDSWGMKAVPVEGNEPVADGAISILPKRSEIPEFTRYFTGLRIAEVARNPWFEEYWQFAFKCRFDRQAASALNLSVCTSFETFDMTTFKQEGLVQMVIDSVYALAHAVRNLIMEHCEHLYHRPLRKFNLFVTPKLASSVSKSPLKVHRYFHSLWSPSLSLAILSLDKNLSVFIWFYNWRGEIKLKRPVFLKKSGSRIIEVASCGPATNYSFSHRTVAESSSSGTIWIIFERKVQTENREIRIFAQLHQFNLSVV